MTTTQAASKSGGARVAVQKFGTFLSGMIMPNIPALIAWGILTALFIEVGPFPNADLATMVGPIIHYLLPIMIAGTGGRMVYETRGAVVGAFAVMGAIVGSDLLIDRINAEGEGGLGYVHMFIGAMILGPLAAWVMKQLDKLWDGKVRAGFEMLVNMFSAGIVAFLMALLGFYLIAPIVNWIMSVVGGAVGWLVDTGLLWLASFLIEPAKVFFLNNAINHGVLTPLGTTEVATDGSSILFLLEANPGPGLGLLLAFSFFGVGAARATAPGAAIIQFAGGIHEVYFPYALMKPTLIIALVLGGASGVATNMLLGTGLAGPAAPGSIFAVAVQAGLVGIGNLVGVLLSVVVAAAVTFLVAAVILRASRKRDLAREDAGDLSAAIAKTEAAKGKKSEHLSNLAAGGAAAGTAADAGGTAVVSEPIRKIVFACDAGMGSSAMGASVLRNKLKKAGIEGIEVKNVAIANLDGSEDLIVTHQDLTARARLQNDRATHVSVENFMNSPKYDDVVTLVGDSNATE
ncbi:PTS system D-mannitol-specific IIA component, Fru family /PTS system D-mannitol-specific IIB component, Fru family /PTS system D-mannitol-specific IIC component, Fru family [Agrococcus baldri]|uniref:PTS system mannitol-specific EIICB component n=1 Tax=Agrococcus baldri TaxID=153730 RepID=A0AA94HL01_9MICO|nr:PTS mannitol transporter subunit IICB [Agrococcus baldri]SFS02752.1 PTS system D-mannitol-specific IIA component, Fru family /PTS system D-mannitol-specific IIB component, Fru family /PTS system D-mannitol-specific IIC component, Fru family [Agrococcus baldri]